MSTPEVILVVIVTALSLVPFIVYNEIQSKKEKALRARLQQLRTQAKAMPANASPEDAAALQAQVDSLSHDIGKFTGRTTNSP